MLKLYRYISSKWRMLFGNNTPEHKMSQESLLGDARIALGQMLDYLQHNSVARLNTVITSRSNDVSELLTSITEIHDSVMRAKKFNKVMYLNKNHSSWLTNEYVSKRLDLWLVDEDGFFIYLESVLANLHQMLSEIEEVLLLPEFDELRYYYHSRPKGIYGEIISVVDQLK